MQMETVWTGTMETEAIKARQRRPDPAPEPSFTLPSGFRGLVAAFFVSHDGYFSIAQIMASTGLTLARARYVVNDMVRDGLVEREGMPLYGSASKATGQVQRYRWRTR